MRDSCESSFSPPSSVACEKLRRLVKTNSFALHLAIAAIEESWSKKEGGKGEDV
jgi:hypothetical protein